MFNSLENYFKLFYKRDFCTLIFEKKIPTVDRPPLGRFAPSSRTLDKCGPFEVLPLQNSVFRRACSWTFEVHSKIFWLYSECINNIRASSIGRPACLIFFIMLKHTRCIQSGTEIIEQYSKCISTACTLAAFDGILNILRAGAAPGCLLRYI